MTPDPKAVQALKQQRSSEKHVLHGGVEGREFCSVQPGVRPRRLAPGQSGACELVLALKNNAVLKPDTGFALQYEHQQDGIQLGKWHRDKAPLGTLYPLTRNRPIYDNTVQVKIPIRVAPNAKAGDHHLNIALRTVFHNGDSGEPLGRYRDLVVCTVEVGAPLPGTVVPRTAKKPPQPAIAGMTPDKPVAEKEAVEADASKHASWVEGDGSHRPGADPAADGELPPAVASGSGTWLWLTGLGGVLVVGLAGLILHHLRQRP